MKKERSPAIPTRKGITIRAIPGHRGIPGSAVGCSLTNSPVISPGSGVGMAEATTVRGYQQNPLAGDVRYHLTPTIGVIVHGLNNPFIPLVLTGISSVVADAGYDVIVACSAECSAKEALNARNFLKRRVDGVIASRVGDHSDMSHFNGFQDKKVPVIFFDGAEQYPGTSMVAIDHAACSYQATQHLLGQGCRRIVLVTGGKNSEIYAQRYRGYAEALNDYGIGLNEDLILANGLNAAAGMAAADAMMRMYPQPDGAFITDDYTAVACMNKLTGAGWCIPEDLALVGFNDDYISRVVTPQLTTIRYPGIEIGETAARSLINHLKGYNTDREVSTVVRSQLIKRASSQRLGNYSTSQ